MTLLHKSLLALAVGLPITLYGWLCWFRTEMFKDFPMGAIYPKGSVRDSISYSMTKVHGAFGLVIGPGLVLYSIYTLTRILFT